MIRLAGLLSDNSNLGILNTVITGEVNKIKAAGTIKGAIPFYSGITSSVHD
jgi:hypothetical protein